MTRLEELKMKRNAALIVVCTLGLAGAHQVMGAGDMWRSNIFQGTSVSQNAGVGFILKIVSFLFLTVLLAVPLFVIYLIKLIYYSIEMSKLSRAQTDGSGFAPRHRNQPVSINHNNEINRQAIDPFDITYYYREDGQLYGPFTIYELVDLEIKRDTLLGVNGVDLWCHAKEIGNLLSTLSLLAKLRERGNSQNLR